MTELRRLLGGEGEQLEVALLKSARDDAPSAASRAKSLVALGLGASVTATAASASSTAAATGVTSGGAALKSTAGLKAATAAKGAVLSAKGATAAAQAGAVASTVGKGMVLVKWVGIASVGTVSTWAVVDQVREPEPVTASVIQSPNVPHAPAIKASIRPSKMAADAVGQDDEPAKPDDEPLDDQVNAEAAVVEAEAIVLPEPASKPVPASAEHARTTAPRAPLSGTHAAPLAPKPMPAPPTEKSQATNLSDELAVLDRAQKALHAGDGVAALAAIDNYDQRFTEKRLGPEASVLRIEAMLGQGKHDRARELALVFLAAHPGSPYAQRVRHLAKQAEER